MTSDITELSPDEAAKIANLVYAVQENSLEKAIKLTQGLGFGDQFEGDGGSRLVGRTGSHFAGASTGFGYVARGVGKRAGEHLIALRGTTTPCDWLSNLNQCLSPGFSGHMVHEGFLSAAMSVIEQIRLSRKGKGFEAVHLVGHSLGGAISTLVADHMSNSAILVKLYTFGAPRAGCESYSDYLTGKLGVANIYRVSHLADPVPMVPIYPFAHVPRLGHGYLLSGTGLLVNPMDHQMQRYAASVGGYTWSSLPAMAADPFSLNDTEAWLKSAAQDGGRVKMMSASALWMLVASLNWILQRVRVHLGLRLLSTATVLDRLALILHLGLAATLALAESIRDLMLATMRFLGRTVERGVDLTVAFIRWVLGLLFGVLANSAQLALERHDH